MGRGFGLQQSGQQQTLKLHGGEEIAEAAVGGGEHHAGGVHGEFHGVQLIFSVCGQNIGENAVVIEVFHGIGLGAIVRGKLSQPRGGQNIDPGVSGPHAGNRELLFVHGLHQSHGQGGGQNPGHGAFHLKASLGAGLEGFENGVHILLPEHRRQLVRSLVAPRQGEAVLKPVMHRAAAHPGGHVGLGFVGVGLTGLGAQTAAAVEDGQNAGLGAEAVGIAVLTQAGLDFPAEVEVEVQVIPQVKAAVFHR